MRKAFSLAIDRNYIVEQVTQAGEIAADAWVPVSVVDAEGTSGDDFRTVGGSYWSVSKDDYEANCEEARKLLAEAGYENGVGFPETTYLYNTDDKHQAVAEALQSMWKNVLGVEVTLNNQDWNVFLETRTKGDYSICRNGWIADYNDPVSFLDMFMTDNGNNDAHYSNAEYDAIMTKVLSDSDAAGRMELMHQAEDLLVGEDQAIAPCIITLSLTWWRTMSTACTTPRWATSCSSTLPRVKFLSDWTKGRSRMAPPVLFCVL